MNNTTAGSTRGQVWRNWAHRLMGRRNVLIAINLLVVGIGVYALWSTWRVAMRDALVDSRSMARLAALSTAVELDKAANAVDSVVFQLDRQLAGGPIDPSQLGALIDSQMAQAPAVQHIGVFDAQGRQICGLPRQGCPELDIGARDDYQALRDQAVSRSQMYGPYPGQGDGSSALVLASRLQHPGGRFAGVVVARLSLRLDLAGVEPGPRGYIDLLTEQRQRVLRLPAPASGAAAELPAAEASGRSGDGAGYQTGPDGIERQVVEQRLAHYPLQVVVSRAVDDILSDWHREASWIIAFLGLFGLASVGVTWLLLLSRVKEQQRELFYDHAPCGYHALDVQGRYLDINATELGWLGCERHELIGRLGLVDFLAPESQSVFRAGFAQFLRDGRIEQIELELIGRDGRRRRVAASATARFDAVGRVQSSHSVMHDISDLHAARQQLQALVQEQGAMLDTDLIGVLKLHQRQIVWANQGCERMFGYRSDELIGQTTQMLHGDEASYQSRGAVAYELLARGEHYRAELPLRRRDGSLLWADVRGAALSTDGRETLWLMSDITAFKQAQEQVRHLAFHDALTGLPNRRMLADRLQQALALAQRDRTLLAVCLLDLDGFKPVNDQHGHHAGDQVLQAVAAQLLGSVRGHDTVARLGGDEFVLLLTQLSQPEEIDLILARVATAVATPVTLGSGAVVAVSTAIGRSLYPQDGSTLDALLGHADQAMYRAKHGNRHRRARLPPAQPAA